MEQHELFGVTKEQLADIRTWATVQLKVVQFQNQSSRKTFKGIFGDVEGGRLFEHFVLDCKNNFSVFTTYLIAEQKNTLWKHIINLS